MITLAIFYQYWYLYAGFNMELDGELYKTKAARRRPLSQTERY